MVGIGDGDEFDLTWDIELNYNSTLIVIFSAIDLSEDHHHVTCGTAQYRASKGYLPSMLPYLGQSPPAFPAVKKKKKLTSLPVDHTSVRYQALLYSTFQSTSATNRDTALD